MKKEINKTTTKDSIEYLEQCNPFSDLVNEVRLDNKSIEIVLSMLEEKEKIIDLMTNELALYCEINCEEDIKTNKEQIRQYFENKAST